MYKNLIRISTVGMSREDWLAQRRGSIGGSDAAGILGLSKWASPFSVWADKTGRLPEKPDNEAMRQGRDLEDYVARRFEEAFGKRVRRENAILRNPNYPFAHANVDRIVIGENAGLECKTTSMLNLKEYKLGSYPENYYAQCVHYMAITGADRWYLAVLVLNQGFYVYTIERDQAEIDALMYAEREFCTRYVVPDLPPPPDGGEATDETLQTIYADAHEGTVDLFGRETLLDQYFEVSDRIKELTRSRDMIAQTIKTDLGELEDGACKGYAVTWKPQDRRAFDAKRFQQEHPEISLDPYYNITSSRVLRINKKEEKQ